MQQFLVSYAVLKDGHLSLRDTTVSLGKFRPLNESAIESFRDQLKARDASVDGPPVILSITKLETP